ncbi:NAD-glutamate dehydrogenase [Nocardioides sp. HDW12B]|uniref:NAD-glutamate dehydrogenase n=1 Tax=Nocardioides sp. HDW12B TaxID=2714939 RepID=UPI001408121A|nr:NAD-glutamate dehydrogenase [Nocardioides sp. HDW12B]QIK65180.1 NAD-glutamate dehydrogenase [Nocardioides sp. HDW12B]
MSDWLEGLSTLQVILLVLAVVFGASVVAAVLGAWLVRMGMHRPAVVRRASALSEKGLGLVKRPLTIVVLDEVAAVIQTGHYTKNISQALLENHDELKDLVAEKVKRDPNVRLIGRLPGYDTIVSEVSETTLRVLIEMLSDPRMDELISDLLRNNLEQIKRAVRDRDHENVGPPKPPDPIPPSAPRIPGP